MKLGRRRVPVPMLYEGRLVTRFLAAKGYKNIQVPSDNF